VSTVAAVFQIAPYASVGDIRFGMSEQEVERVLGPPIHRDRNRKGEIEEYREGIKVYYADGAVAELVLMAPARALYKGTDLLGLEAPVAFLTSDDPRPFEYMGATVFLDIGLALTGFAEPDDPDTSVTAFARGRWDHLRSKLRPFRV